MSTTTMNEDSKRWTHFHSALQLAINRAAHKWTFEDFQECFPLWCKEEPYGAEAISNTISRHIEDQIHVSCEALFKDFSVRERINVLHRVVTEARARNQQSKSNGKDVWREDLDPRVAVRAKTVPVLETEVEKLRATLRSLEEENLALFEQTKANDERQQESEVGAARLLRDFAEIYSRWTKLNQDEISLWALQSTENLPQTQPP